LQHGICTVAAATNEQPQMKAVKRVTEKENSMQQSAGRLHRFSTKQALKRYAYIR